ncbi:ribonuclease domain-containing protein [Kitasatospora sp. McL0602]|uniref:ribonuclease domain-containing protein n=1 Tax=Kitasatospora sp. McL0602 TaxID=3439530 RepID=UPI003F8A16F0
MTSRNRLLAVVAVLVCAVVAAAVYALSGTGKSTPSAARSSSARPSVTAKPSAPAGRATTWVPTNASIADVCRSKLPSQARDTLGLIDKGGPYPYRNDGIVFENRESRLPKQATGYYHEYTVVTPGSDDRGTRRVVTGSVGEEYWTGDHYSTFQEIDSRC